MLIGVNDVVRGVPGSMYAANVEYILDALVAAVGAERALAVSTPDYTLTPHGADYGNPAQQRAAIARFNETMAAACARRGIAFVSIDAVANEAALDPSLVANDGLHPSAVQYARWVDLIAPVATKMLRARR